MYDPKDQVDKPHRLHPDGGNQTYYPVYTTDQNLHNYNHQLNPPPNGDPDQQIPAWFWSKKQEDDGSE